MTEVLSQDEIDQLLTAISSGDTTIENVSKTTSQKKVRIYDFRRPSRFSKEQHRAIQMIYDSFSRFCQTTLSALLRTPIHFHVASVDELTFEEFTRSIPNPTTMAILNMDPLKGNAIFEIDPSISFAMIDRIFGGKGKSFENSNRELTDIEIAVIESIIIKLLNNLREAWANFVDLRPRLSSIDTNPQFASIVPPTDMTILVTLETKIGEVEGMSNFCLPHLTLEPIITKLTPQIWYSSISKSTGTENFTSLKRNIEDVPLDISVILGKTNLSVRDILDFNVDDVILFNNTDINSDIDVQIGNRTKFKGRPGIYQGNVAIQITKIVENIDVEDIFTQEEDNG